MYNPSVGYVRVSCYIYVIFNLPCFSYISWIQASSAVGSEIQQRLSSFTLACETDFTRTRQTIDVRFHTNRTLLKHLYKIVYIVCFGVCVHVHFSIFLFHTETTLDTLRQRLMHDISKVNPTIAFAQCQARPSEVSSPAISSSSSVLPATSHLTKLMTL